MSDRKAKAVQTFQSGCNCAQAVLMNYHDVLLKDENELMAFASGFGGGMGRLQYTCGAVTGSFMVFSLYAAMHSESNAQAKALSSELIREFDEKFRKIKGSVNCREILGVDLNSEEGKQEAEEKNLFETVCADAVKTATGIVEEILDARNA